MTITDSFMTQETPPVLSSAGVLNLFSAACAFIFPDTDDYFGKSAKLRLVKQFAIHHEAKPGDQVRLELILEKCDAEESRVNGLALIDGVVAAEATLIYSMTALPKTPHIHPLASVHHSAVIGKDVEIGPYAVIGEEVVIGEGTRISPHVMIEKWTRIGEHCQIFFGAVIGSASQDKKYLGGKSWVKIGDRTTIREYVTINRATDREVTEIGNDCLLLTGVHIAHDVKVGNHVVMSNASQIAGHVIIDDYAIIGGMTGVHQFCRIGRSAMVGGYSRISQDIPPYTLCEGIPAAVRGLNIVGIKRAGIPVSTLTELKAAYKILYRSEYNTSQAISELKKLNYQSPEFLRFLQFIDTESSRGLILKSQESEE